MHRCPDRHRAIGQELDLDRRRQRRLQLRQQLLDAVDDLDDVGAGLALDIDDDRRLLVGPRREPGILGAVDDVGDVGQAHRRAVAVRDDHALVIAGGLELIVGIDRRRPSGAVEAALGLVRIGIAYRGAQVVERQPVRGQRGRVGLDAHRRALPAADAHQPDARKLRELGCEARVGKILDLGQRQRFRCQREGHDRRVGRIDLVVDRRRRQVRGQEASRCVDRRLHLLLRNVEGQAEVELQRDDRRSAGAGRRHLLEPRHLPELALERRGNRRGHHVRAGARVKAHDLDRRVIDLRQRGNRQDAVGEDAREQDRDHQQRGRHRPQDERAGRTHRRVRRLQPPLLERRVGSPAPLRGAVAGPARRGIGIDELHLRAVAQLVRAVDHHLVPRLQPALHLGGLALHRAQLDRRDRDGLIRLDQEHEGAGSATLDRRRRNQRRALPGLDAHPHVDELVGKKRAILVGEFRLELHRPCRGVDLIVDREQAAGRKLRLATAVIRLDGDRPVRSASA